MWDSALETRNYAVGAAAEADIRHRSISQTRDRQTRTAVQIQLVPGKGLVWPQKHHCCQPPTPHAQNSIEFSSKNTS